jgi:hypothetical protein
MFFDWKRLIWSPNSSEYNNYIYKYNMGPPYDFSMLDLVEGVNSLKKIRVSPPKPGQLYPDLEEIQVLHLIHLLRLRFVITIAEFTQTSKKQIRFKKKTDGQLGIFLLLFDGSCSCKPGLQQASCVSY